MVWSALAGCFLSGNYGDGNTTNDGGRAAFLDESGITTSAFRSQQTA
ncbi:hypothetical protein [Paracoccus sp. N5]|nr:hypothetical protein [Paracoccus sp. N5]